MTTLTELVKELKIANPQPLYKTINDEQIELTDAEYKNAIEALAKMQLEQKTVQIEFENKAAARQAVLDKLGLTADEVTALFG